MVVWLAHESDESMCKPSNLKEVTLSMVPVDVVRNGRFERAKGPSIISLVLVVFISMALLKHTLPYICTSVIMPNLVVLYQRVYA